MIKRFFKFENFRTLGVKDEEELELTAIDDISEGVGGLVLIIGLNNSGKSNIIEAIKQFSTGNIENSNAPKYIYEPNCIPTVKYIVKTDDGVYEVMIKGNKQTIEYNGKDLDHIQKVDPETLKVVTYLLDNKERLINLVTNPQMRNNYKLMENLLYELEKCENKDDFINNKNNLNQLIHSLSRNGYFIQQCRASIEVNEIFDNLKVLNEMITNDEKQDIKIMKHYEGKYNIKLKPTILEYNDKSTFSSSDMNSQLPDGRLVNDKFFAKLFSMLESIRIENLETCYRRFHQYGGTNKGVLDDFEKKVNRELKVLSDKFNKVYQVNKSQYDFSLSLETNRIDFIIRDSNQSVYFDDQSSGFKWFFNFFFDMLSDKTLEKGSIILMDEPATNLHVIGQIELRRLIKDLAIQNEWTFIISTHSPFLIDIDNLDELRVVEKKDYITRINNKFTLIDENNADVLYPIRSALTIRKNILINVEDTLLFVEGITDYNYIVGFKKLFEQNDLNILPIQGIKKENLLNQLLKVTKNPLLLVDSDKVGQEVYEYYKDNKNIEIIQLNEIDDKFIEIEDLFSEEDQKKFEFINGKKYYKSVNFKNKITEIKESLSKETVNNFEKLLNRIMS